MQIPYKKLMLKKPEVRSAGQVALSSLHDCIFLNLLAKHSSYYLHDVFRKNHTATTIDLLNWWDTYIQQCLQEIEMDYGIKQTSQKLSQVQQNNPPSAQPLKAFIEKARGKKRYDLIALLGERYYALNQWPALCLLAHSGYLDACRVLCSGYIEINCRDHTLKTPLMRAAQTGKTDVVKFLINFPHIDLSCQTRCNEDALKLAQNNNHHEIVKMLEEALQNKKTQEKES